MFIADDTIVASIQFTQQQPKVARKQSASAQTLELSYAMSGPAFPYYSAQDLIKQLRTYQLREFGILSVVDI